MTFPSYSNSSTSAAIAIAIASFAASNYCFPNKMTTPSDFAIVMTPIDFAIEVILMGALLSQPRH